MTKKTKLLSPAEINSLKIRLEKFSEKKPNGCIEWTQATNPKGYGVIRLNRKTNIFTHRASWIINTNSYPKDLILHSCDNPTCFNIEHLKEGTAAENTADMMSKKRNKVFHFKSEDAPPALLKNSDVIAIKLLINARCFELKRLAELFKVSVACINDIKMGRSWPDIGEPIEKGFRYTRKKNLD